VEGALQARARHRHVRRRRRRAVPPHARCVPLSLFLALSTLLAAHKDSHSSHTLHAVGSIHTSFSDLPLLLSSLPLVPSSLARRTGARVDPLVGLGAVVEACGEFLGGEGRAGAVLGREVDRGDGEEKSDDGKTRLVGEPGSWRVHVASEGKKKTA